MRRELVETIANDTMGTCNDPLLDDLSDDELELFDSITLNCHECGWWFEASEIESKDGEQKCGECRQ